MQANSLEFVDRGRPSANGAPSLAILSINYHPELTGISVYTTGMAEYLAGAGHRVTVHTGFPYYPGWQKRPEDAGRLFTAENLSGVRLRRCYLYVPKVPSALRRIVHEFSFTVSATLSYLFAPRAEVTIIVSPPLPLGIPIALAAKLKRSRTVFHVQDLQPDAAVDLGMLPKGPIANILFAIERWSYRLCDKVSTISDAMASRIVAKGVAPSKVSLLRNWADEELTARGLTGGSFREHWGIEDRFVVLYAGNLGVKQGLSSLIEMAGMLRDEPKILVVIVGDGGEKQTLMKQAASAGLENVIFKPSVPKSQLGDLLALADVAIIPQKASVKDIVLPSKLGNLLLSSCPVIACASEDSDLGKIVKANECGEVVPQEDVKRMTAAVLKLHRDPTLRDRYGANGSAYARAQLTKGVILENFHRQLTDLVDA